MATTAQQVSTATTGFRPAAPPSHPVAVPPHPAAVPQRDASRPSPAQVVPPDPDAAVAGRIDFDALKSFVRGRFRQVRADYTPAAELTSAVAAALPHVTAVSFDIFDTALIRYVEHPADVFLHLEQHPLFQAHRFKMPVARLRARAEATARSMVYKVLKSYEVNLLEVYQVFCDLAGIHRQYAAGFVEVEEQVELSLCVTNPAIHAVYRQAQAAGKQILFVSDIYHTRDFLLRLLASVGYEAGPNTLFASSLTRKSKQSGELFPLVLATTGLEASRLLHLGDHPISDFARAGDVGVRAILHTHKACKDELTLQAPEHERGTAERHARLAAQSFMRGMINGGSAAALAAGRGDDFWWKLGYAAAGPLTLGFSQWLEQKLREDGVDHAYFMLRDGALLNKVYQALYADDPRACRGSALMTSRRSSLLPILEIAPSFALQSLLGGIGLRPVREYIDRLELDSDRYAAEARAAGYSGLDERIDGRFDGQRLLKLLLQPRVIEALRVRCRREREPLEMYLRQEGVTARNRVGLVDLGWSGTVHKSLQILLEQVKPSLKVVGYYIATFPEAPHSVVPGLEVRSYLAHRGEPQQVYRQILQFLNFFEIVYSSTEGSLLYFEKDPGGSGVVPIRQASDKSEAQCRHLDAVHAGAIAFALEYKRRSAGLALPNLPPEAASELFFRIILQPTAEEARHLGGTVHCDNLGSASQHVSAELRSSLDPVDLMTDYENAHWKQGLLAGATPETAALRTLLWLSTLHPSELAVETV